MTRIEDRPNRRILLIDDSPAIHDDFRKVYGNFKGRVGEKMSEARQVGLLRLEGKTYIVQDGDIVHIL